MVEERGDFNQAHVEDLGQSVVIGHERILSTYLVWLAQPPLHDVGQHLSAIQSSIDQAAVATFTRHRRLQNCINSQRGSTSLNAKRPIQDSTKTDAATGTLFRR